MAIRIPVFLPDRIYHGVLLRAADREVWARCTMPRLAYSTWRRLRPTSSRAPRYKNNVDLKIDSRVVVRGVVVEMVILNR